MTPWLLPFCLHIYVQSFVLAGLTWCVGLWRRPKLHKGFLMVEWRPWFAKRWNYVTTIGYAMGHSEATWPPDRTDLWFHETGVHTPQMEDLCVLGAILGGIVAIADWRFGLGVYLSSGPLWQIPNFFTALPRYRKSGKAAGVKTSQIMYRGSSHERDAYAQEWGKQRGRNEVPW